jgi:radical SAM superfamily enzyme YgiQ (UPF0313 family)
MDIAVNGISYSSKSSNGGLYKKHGKPKIVLAVCPYEGEVIDRVTHQVYKPSVVKYMPLGLLSLAASVADYDVTIVDGASRGLTVNEMLKEIESLNPDILGLSVVTYRAWSMREILRRSTAQIKVVGGPHATENYNYILEQGADAVFVGDAEETFSDWLKKGCPPGVIKGNPVDLDNIPYPNRNLVNLDDYRIESSKGLLFDVGNLRLPIYSSKGCPLKCIYCDVQQKKFYSMSPGRIVEEFKMLESVGATSVHILDDAFNIQKDRVIKFCNLLVESGIKIDWSVRGIVEVREEVVKALAEAGCRRFHVGIEHLDDDVLAYFRKSHRYEHVQRFCNLCKKYGIDILGYFIIGAPGETSEYRQKLPDIIKELGISIPYFNVLTPLSETIFYQQLLEDGTFSMDFWDDFSRDPVKNFEIPSHRSTEEEDELQRVLKSYISIFNT